MKSFKSTLLILSLLFLMQFIQAQHPHLKKVREMFFDYDTVKCSAGEIYAFLSGIGIVNAPVMLAYKGSSRAMMAQCTRWPLSKWKYFTEGKDILEHAVSIDGQNPEIRFLRFQIQSNIPAFLDYNNILEDKAYLLKEIPLQVEENKQDRDFYIRVARLLLSSDHLTREENAALRSFWMEHR